MIDTYLLRTILKVSVALVIIALSAQLSMELGSGIFKKPIPITGQSLAVICISMVLNRRLGFITILLYLLLGGLGFPVFADGEGGWSHLLGPSAGYLWSFLFLPFLMDVRNNQQNFFYLFLFQVLGTIFILTLGFIRLRFITADAYALGVQPFFTGGLLKSLTGAGFVWLYFKAVRQ